ncbi:MAG: hypothetical protein ACR2LD_08115 [Actinomycetota bacterium]
MTLPLGAHDVLVDLELRFQTAVFGAELQFPIAAAATVALALESPSPAIAGRADKGTASAATSIVKARSSRVPTRPTLLHKHAEELELLERQILLLV